MDRLREMRDHLLELQADITRMAIELDKLEERERWRMTQALAEFSERRDG
jgi:hypothetical protein